tara:strand:- start:59533 stop:60696 length:1164 start_codon:yes stop_codon:yes gene_type:complete
MNKWIKMEEKYGSGAYGNWPLALEKGSGSYIWDTKGRRYLDLGTGIGVTGLGHANKEISNAISNQVNELSHAINGYFASPVRANLLKKISEIAPGNLDRSFLTNSGTEAIEAAIKLARMHTKRTKIISMIRGYHGRSMGALSATWRRDYREPCSPLVPDFYHVPYGKTESLKKVIDNQVAAIILEPIQGEGGVIIPPEGYLENVREICDENGVLLVSDEIQTGIGRTGKWFSCEHENVVPDMICSAKNLGGGFPIGALVMSNNLSFERGKHGSTYGGNLLGCQAALAVINFMEKNNILNHVESLGKWAIKELQNQLNESEIIKDIRGKGLIIGIELKAPARPFLQSLLNKGVLALSAGKKTIRLLPPLNITKSEFSEGITNIVEVLS